MSINKSITPTTKEIGKELRQARGSTVTCLSYRGRIVHARKLGIKKYELVFGTKYGIVSVHEVVDRHQAAATAVKFLKNGIDGLYSES